MKPNFLSCWVKRSPFALIVKSFLRCSKWGRPGTDQSLYQPMFAAQHCLVALHYGPFRYKLNDPFFRHGVQRRRQVSATHPAAHLERCLFSAAFAEAERPDLMDNSSAGCYLVPTDQYATPELAFVAANCCVRHTAPGTLRKDVPHKVVLRAGVKPACPILEIGT